MPLVRHFNRPQDDQAYIEQNGYCAVCESGGPKTNSTSSLLPALASESYLSRARRARLVNSSRTSRSRLATRSAPSMARHASSHPLRSMRASSVPSACSQARFQPTTNPQC